MQMFLKRNQPRKTQCFIEKRRLGAGDVDNVKEEVVTMVPIQLNEAILRDSIANSGQRVSIICNTDSSDAPTERSVRLLPHLFCISFRNLFVLIQRGIIRGESCSGVL